MRQDGRLDSALDRSRALADTLDALAESVSRGDLAAVTDGEDALRALVAPLSSEGASPDAGTRGAVHHEVRRARAALARCRALGVAHAFITTATLDALGRRGDYGPHGSAGAAPVNRGVDLRVRA